MKISLNSSKSLRINKQGTTTQDTSVSSTTSATKYGLCPRISDTQRPSKKLDWKCLGPYPIVEKISTQAYRLQLPPSLKVHPVFHVSLLDPYKESEIPGRTQPPPPPVVIEDQFEYEVEEILDSRLIRNRLFYLIKWKGYPASDNLWEPVAHLTNCKNLIISFHSQYPDKPSTQLSPREPDQPKRNRRK